MGSDSRRYPLKFIPPDFNPRSPHGERLGARGAKNENQYFNPRSPHGERPAAYYDFVRSLEFQSTLPAWGATTRFCSNRGFTIFQSTLPAWGATYGITSIPTGARISIHAPRMGSDNKVTPFSLVLKDFNPRSPHGERLMVNSAIIRIYIFQSTLPAWGATNEERRK